MNTQDVRHYKALDSMRGLAAMAVVLHHVLHAMPETTRDRIYGLDLAIFVGARFAVLFFFVLSGFVLALPYCRATNDRYLPFLIRRGFRLYPPFAFAVLIAASLCEIFAGQIVPGASSWLNGLWDAPVTLRGLVAHLLMTGLHDKASTRLDPVIWSLIIEMRVSLIFPILVLFVRRFRGPAIISTLAFGLICAKLCAALGQPSPVLADSPFGTLLLTGRYLGLFAAGIGLAAGLPREKALFLRVPMNYHLITVLLIVMASLVLGAAQLIDSPFVDLFFGVVSAYVILAVLTLPWAGRVVSGPICLWLGRISYSLYLIHLPVILGILYLTRDRAPLWATLCLALPCALAVAHVMNRLIEKPSENTGRLFARRIRAHNG